MLSELDIGEDIELLRLLQTAAPIDVSKLVDILTDGKEGRIALAASVKETLQEAQASACQPGGRFLEGEIRLVIRELQLFAGNSLRNATRGSGVPYQQLAKDVLEHLGGTCDPLAAVEHIELLVVEQLATRRWQLNDANERSAIAAAAGVEGGAEAPLFAIQSALRNGGDAAIAVAELPRLTQAESLASLSKASTVRALATVARVAALSLVQQAAAEAYRVTLPGLVQISLIRQKSKLGRKIQSTAGSSLKVDTAPQAGSQVTAWALGASPERALMTASPLPVGEWRHEGRRIADDATGGISRLAPLLQTLPGLAAAVQQQGAEYVRVVVNGKLAQAADGDGLRGFVRAADGKFVEHARFYEDAKLQNLVNSAALFQVASAVVAQKHLADISARLDSIDREIKKTNEFLTESRRAVMVKAMGYLMQVAGPLLGGNQSAYVRQKLEDIEFDVGAIQEHLLIDIKNLASEALTAKYPDTIGTAGLTRTLQRLQSDLHGLVSQWTLCQRTRLAACQLVSTFPDEGVFLKSRHDELRELERDFFDADGAVATASAAIKTRTAKITSKFESTAETFARQIRLDRWHQVQLAGLLSASQSSLEQSMPMLNLGHSEPVTLAVRLQGQQVEVYDLSERRP